MIDPDIAAQVLGKTSNSPPSISIDPDIANSVLNSAAPPHSIDTMQAIGAGVTKGVDDFNIATRTLKLAGQGLSKLGYPTLEQKVDSYRQSIANDYNQAAQDSPIAANVGRLAGGVGATLPIFAIDAPVAIASKAPLVGKIIQGALQGGATGALAQDGDFVDNTALGAAVGGAIPGVLGLAGKAISGAKGAIIGKTREDAPELMNLSKQYNIPLTKGDISKRGVYPTLEKSLLDNMIVGGTADLRAKQADAYIPAYKQLMSTIAPHSNGTLSSVSSDINSLATNLKKQASVKFDVVDKLSKDAGNVDITGLKQAAAGLLDEANKGTIKGAYVTRLKDILEKGITKSGSPASNLVDESGNPLVSAVASSKSSSIPFSEARILRTTIGGEINALQNSATKTNDVVLGGYKKIFGALENDLDKWGASSNSTQLAGAYSEAKNFYKGYAGIFKDPEIKSAMASDAQMYDYLMQAAKEKNPYKAEKLSNAVGNQDQLAAMGASDLADKVGDTKQQNLRAYILSNAFNKAYDPNNKVFNPATFVGEIDKLGLSSNVYFGDKITAIRGLNKLLIASRGGFDAGQYNRTGVQAVKMAGTLGTIAGGGAAVGYAKDGDSGAAAGAGAGVSAALVFGLLARNPQLFIQAAKISDKTDPSVVKHMVNAFLKRAAKQGVNVAAVQQSQ
jgi:hypothetical protein